MKGDDDKTSNDASMGRGGYNWEPQPHRSITSLHHYPRSQTSLLLHSYHDGSRRIQLSWPHFWRPALPILYLHHGIDALANWKPSNFQDDGPKDVKTSSLHHHHHHLFNFCNLCLSCFLQSFTSPNLYNPARVTATPAGGNLSFLVLIIAFIVSVQHGV